MVQVNSHLKLVMTLIANLAKAKVDPHAKDEGRRSNGSAVRVHTNGRTLPSALSPSLRGR